MKRGRKQLEKLYDSYSPMLYGIALKLSPSIEDAESILLATFYEIFNQRTVDLTGSPVSFSLVRIMIRIAHDRFNPGGIQNYFGLPYLKNAPVLHYLICDQKGIEGYCTDHGITREEALIKLHDEFAMMRSQRGKSGISPQALSDSVALTGS